MSRLLGAAVVVAAALVLAGCGSSGKLAAGEGNRSQGKRLFQQKCASCHALADAGSKANIGPNLDEAFKYARDESVEQQGFDESTIRDVVRGQISYPVENPVTGQTGMPSIDKTLPQCKKKGDPPGCVDDQDAAADDIAAYVAAVAGLPVRAQPGGSGGGAAGGGGATDGKSIFASAGCSGCHTLAAAGASGNVGPNLDEAKPSVDRAIQRVTEGKGAMPSFEGRLSEAQIKAVADYVAKSAGK